MSAESREIVAGHPMRDLSVSISWLTKPEPGFYLSVRMSDEGTSYDIIDRLLLAPDTLQTILMEINRRPQVHDHLGDWELSDIAQKITPQYATHLWELRNRLLEIARAAQERVKAIDEVRP